jgi:hypothetical protein
MNGSCFESGKNNFQFTNIYSVLQNIYCNISIKSHHFEGLLHLAMELKLETNKNIENNNIIIFFVCV